MLLDHVSVKSRVCDIGESHLQLGDQHVEVAPHGVPVEVGGDDELADPGGASEKDHMLASNGLHGVAHRCVPGEDGARIEGLDSLLHESAADEMSCAHPADQPVVTVYRCLVESE
ncbi:MAG: hypothetical protein OSB43_17980 [Nocardioides sp.]|uniref:hypothetical protein n=1 Tax=Nocardioides sp. TaxID=35761 RepID=UPI00238591F4|nr:hypothetical protein [Nocardioides sp.]MDE0778173.1 hypothetical protein [Nocardioides sp.]